VLFFILIIAVLIFRIFYQFRIFLLYLSIQLINPEHVASPSTAVRVSDSLNGCWRPICSVFATAALSDALVRSAV